MPDFDLLVSGAPVVQWLDPDGTDRPSRLCPKQGRTMLRRKATVGVEVTLTAVVEGVEGPADGDLGGRLFVAACQESPLGYPAAFSSPSGYSSIQSFTPDQPGHYLVYLRRPEGGAVLVHLDAEVGT